MILPPGGDVIMRRSYHGDSQSVARGMVCQLECALCWHGVPQAGLSAAWVAGW